MQYKENEYELFRLHIAYRYCSKIMEPENNMKEKDQFSKTGFFSSNFLMEVGGDTCGFKANSGYGALEILKLYAKGTSVVS
jgi:hypothetical protein